MKCRNLYKYHGEFQVPKRINSAMIKKGFKNQLLDKFSLETNDIIIQHFQIGYGNNEHYPLQNVKFYNYKNNNISFTLYKKDIKLLMPSSFCQKNHIRIFSRSNHNNVKKLVEQIKNDIFK